MSDHASKSARVRYDFVVSTVIAFALGTTSSLVLLILSSLAFHIDRGLWSYPILRRSWSWFLWVGALAIHLLHAVTTYQIIVLLNQAKRVGWRTITVAWTQSYLSLSVRTCWPLLGGCAWSKTAWASIVCAHASRSSFICLLRSMTSRDSFSASEHIATRDTMWKLIHLVLKGRSSHWTTRLENA